MAMPVVWFSLLATVMLVLCVCNILVPRRMWGLFKAWRFKNPEMVEPSDLVVWWYRIYGALGAVLIIGMAVYAVTEYRRHARCEEAAPQLWEAYGSGDFRAVQRRARALGLEAEDPHHGRYSPPIRIVITEDGKPFATLRQNASRAYCDTEPILHGDS